MRATSHLTLVLVLLALGACASTTTPAVTAPAAVTPAVAAPTVFSSPLTHASPPVQPTPPNARSLPLRSVAREFQITMPSRQSPTPLSYHFSLISNPDTLNRVQTDYGEVDLRLEDKEILEQIRAVDYRTHFAVIVFLVDGFYPEPRLQVTQVAWQEQALVVYATFDGTLPKGPMPAASAMHYHIVAVEKVSDVEWGREILVRLNVNGKEVQQQRFFIP